MACIALLLAPSGSTAAAEIIRETLLIEIDGAQHRFAVEIADDETERARGLMFRRSLSEGEGMLFLYPSPRPVSFWMENTYLPLDMLFIAEDGTIVLIVENAQPLSRTPIPSLVPVIAVLEIRGGLARHLGIDAGARLRHPSYFP